MRKSFIVCLFLGQLVILLSAVERKEWTVLIYMSADDLSKVVIDSNIKQIMRTGSSEYLNVLLYVTGISERGIKKTKKIYVERDYLQQIGPTINRDSGDVVSLTESLQWAALDYPSDHLCIILAGSGTGILNRDATFSRGLCFDCQSGNSLTERDFFYAFSWICEHARGGKKIDLVACDASFSCSLEMAYTLAPFVDYFVAPEGVIMEEGLRYGPVLKALSLGSVTPYVLSQLMIRSYAEKYNNMQGCILSCINLRDINLLVDNLNAISQVLLSHLMGKNSILAKSILKKCVSRRECYSFDDGHYIDVLQFYKNILQNISNFKLSKSVVQNFRQTLINGISLFSRIIKGRAVYKQYKNIGGLSIYFARHSIHPSYYGLYWTSQNSNWLHLLEAFSEL